MITVTTTISITNTAAVPRMAVASVAYSQNRALLPAENTLLGLSHHSHCLSPRLPQQYACAGQRAGPNVAKAVTAQAVCALVPYRVKAAAKIC